ncbi:hypothetical protein BU17DRAFT_78888 [Hysterangium stoloniferum]|nr:hypothetical protein BU17DRAFT_78888 [Hysterangium stoloniferum]
MLSTLSLTPSEAVIPITTSLTSKSFIPDYKLFNESQSLYKPDRHISPLWFIPLYLVGAGALGWLIFRYCMKRPSPAPIANSEQSRLGVLSLAEARGTASTSGARTRPEQQSETRKRSGGYGESVHGVRDIHDGAPLLGEDKEDNSGDELSSSRPNRLWGPRTMRYSRQTGASEPQGEATELKEMVLEEDVSLGHGTVSPAGCRPLPESPHAHRSPDPPSIRAVSNPRSSTIMSPVLPLTPFPVAHSKSTRMSRPRPLTFIDPPHASTPHNASPRTPTRSPAVLNLQSFFSNSPTSPKKPLPMPPSPRSPGRSKTLPTPNMVPLSSITPVRLRTPSPLPAGPSTVTDSLLHSQLCFNNAEAAPRTPMRAYSPDQIHGQASLPGSLPSLEGVRSSAHARVDSIVGRSYLARAGSPVRRAVSPTLFGAVEESGTLADAVHVSGDDKVEG